MSDLDRRLREAILDLLRKRGPGKTICPSEVARHVDPDGEWRALMGPVRDTAQRLVEAGEIEMTQRGRAIDPSQVKGAIRLRKK